MRAHSDRGRRPRDLLQGAQARDAGPLVGRRPVGTVRRAQETGREHIFDGIVIDTKRGKRFVDAPEVGRIAERAVTLTITAAEAAELPVPGGGMRARMDQATTVRRAKRMGRSWRDRWDRR